MRMQRWKKGLMLGIFSSMLWEQEAVEAAMQLKMPDWQQKANADWQTRSVVWQGPPALLATGAALETAAGTAVRVDPWVETFRPERLDDGRPATRRELQRLGIQSLEGISPAETNLREEEPAPVEEPRPVPVLASRHGSAEAVQQPVQTAVEDKVQQQAPVSNPMPTLMQGSGANATAMGKAITVALRYQGAPYQFGGTTPNGFDCSGFIQYVMNQAGVAVPRTTYQQFAAGGQVAKSQLQAGDLVFFLGTSHSGIYIGNGQFIHADQTTGITVDNLNEGYWAGVYEAGVRIR